MKKYLLLIFTACTNLPTQPIKEVSKNITDYAKENYPVKGWDTRYSEVIKILQAQNPIQAPCTSVETFLSAIISAESNFNNSSIYKEPPPLNQNSIGFFQLSLTDKSNYGCNFATEKDIQNPILNIECAYKIFTKLKAKYPSENVWEYGGRYWSVLRDKKYPKWAGKNQSGVERVKSYMNKNGCPI